MVQGFLPLSRHTRWYSVGAAVGGLVCSCRPSALSLNHFSLKVLQGRHILCHGRVAHTRILNAGIC